MSRKKDLERITIRDVAEHAGVSISTVSRVLNQSAGVASDKESRVLDAIRSLNYQPNAAARMLPSKRTNTIGVLLPLISGDFISQMLFGIEKGVIEGGFDLLVHSTSLGSKPNDPFKRVLGEHNTDGLIVFSDSLGDEEIIRLYDSNFPLVLLHRSPPEDLEISNVTVRNKSGTRKVVDHLIRVHNRRKIVFLSGPEEHEDSYWREIGYHEALEEFGIEADPALFGMGNFASDDAQDTIEAMILDGVEFDGVFAGDDEAASGVLRALRLAGIDVPDRVSVVGFDNSNLSQHLVPALTTVDAQVELAGYSAAQQLVKIIKDQKYEKQILLPTDLVIRNSCGCIGKA